MVRPCLGWFGKRVELSASGGRSLKWWDFNFSYATDESIAERRQGSDCDKLITGG